MPRSLLIASAGSLVVGLAACGTTSHPAAAERTPQSRVSPSVSSSIPPLPSRPAPSKSSPRHVTKVVRPSITIKRATLAVSGPVGRGATIAVRNQDATAHTVMLHATNTTVNVAGRATTTVRAPEKAGRYAITCDVRHALLVVK
jgi:hypothetical protein